MKTQNQGLDAPHLTPTWREEPGVRLWRNTAPHGVLRAFRACFVRSVPYSFYGLRSVNVSRVRARFAPPAISVLPCFIPGVAKCTQPTRLVPVGFSVF